MTDAFRLGDTKAPEHALFSVLADVLNAWEDKQVRLKGSKVGVNSSRYGFDQAISVRLSSAAGEEEIGKIVIVPMNEDTYEFKVPVNNTGGAELPRLDPKGEIFGEVVGRVLKGLVTTTAP